MRTLHLLLGLFFAATPLLLAKAPEGRIIQISRQMNTSGERSTKEYYINLGRTAKVQVGDIFHVYRDLPIIDAVHGEPVEFLPVQIGELEVLFVGEASSIGRLLSLTDLTKLPKLDYSVMMVGDRVKRIVGMPFQ